MIKIKQIYDQPVKVYTLKLFFSCWAIGRRNCCNLFFTPSSKKNPKTKHAYFTSLCFVHYWLCWYMSYFPYIDFLLKWESIRCSEVDGWDLHVYKVVCWCPFRETSVFKLHVARGGRLAHTADCMPMVPEAWWELSTETHLTWAFLRQEDPTQGLCICHQCYHSDHLDAEFGLLII